jgi:hypothetical protein
MNRALVIPIVAVILLILIAQRVNSNNNSFTGANTQVALAKTGASINSSDSIENPTRSECGSKVGHTGISLTFIAACILLYPNDFKKGEGGTLVINNPDSSEGVEPFGHKK